VRAGRAYKNKGRIAIKTKTMNEEQGKKSIYKKWWFWVIVLLVIFLFSSVRTARERVEDVQRELNMEVAEEMQEGVLSEKDIETITERTKALFEDEKEFEDEEFNLLKIEYDAESNRLSLRVDYQEIKPMFSKEEIISANEAWAWAIAEATPGISEKDFDISVLAVSKVGEDQFIDWGTTVYYFETEKYRFLEAK